MCVGVTGAWGRGCAEPKEGATTPHDTRQHLSLTHLTRERSCVSSDRGDGTPPPCCALVACWLVLVDLVGWWRRQPTRSDPRTLASAGEEGEGREANEREPAPTTTSSQTRTCAVGDFLSQPPRGGVRSCWWLVVRRWVGLVVARRVIVARGPSLQRWVRVARGPTRPRTTAATPVQCMIQPHTAQP